MDEMDPNCFVMEPRQVATLTQNGRLPQIFPLPRPYLDGNPSTPQSSRPRPYATSQLQRRKTDPIGNLLDLAGYENEKPTARRRTATSTLRDNGDDADHALASVPTRRPKKARLCEDMALAENINEAPEQNRFFPSATSTTIVAILPRSTSKAKRPIYKKEDTILMSDDLIIDILLELSDEDS